VKKYLPYILIFLLTLPVARYFFGPGYYIMHDDLQVMRIFQMEKCFSDGQIPCRWSPDMAYGYGQAMFNFYSAFPYYLGTLMRMVAPLSIMGTVKMLFFISLLGAGIGMYLLAREFWGNWGGILAAVLYTFAPYHALDIFVRGALAESFALAILPFLWLTLYLVVKKPSFPKVAGAALSLAALLMTHNISTLMYAPFTVLWVLFWLIYLKNWKSLVSIAIAGLLGIGLAAFFILPVIFEQSLIQIQHLTSEYSDYRAHFVTLKQLFLDRKWGDGPSIFGPKDDISFQIGWPHWWLGVFLFTTAVSWLKKEKKKEKTLLLLGLLGLAGFCAFLTHSRSFFIWKTIPIMAFIQFPWRWLGPTIFFLSFAGGAMARLKIKHKGYLAAGTIFLAVVLNFRYFIPVHFSSKVRDEEKLRGVAFELQQKAAILDYLPKTARVAPEAVGPETPKIISGDGEIFGFVKRSNSFSFETQIYQESEVEIPIMYFPGWIVIVDNQVVPGELHGAHGVMKVTLSPGKHIVRGRFQNTPIRSLGNGLTLLTGFILLAGAVLYENKRRLL
jgi:hypothetical protein